MVKSNLLSIFALMKNEKKKGGKRAGSGRKPGRKKEAVTVYVDVAKFGGKEGVRIAIYEFLDGKFILANKDEFHSLTDLPESDKTIIEFPKPITQKQAVALHNAENKDQFTSTKIMTKKQFEAIEELKGDNLAIQLQIDAIKKEVCLKERDTPMGRKAWQMDQAKRIKDLENKLK